MSSRAKDRYRGGTTLASVEEEEEA